MTTGRKVSQKTQSSAPEKAAEPVPNTSLSPQPEEENVASLQDDISQVSGDPIQQLFTTLGKFHRQLNKAQYAPNGEGWCEECMNELMTGLEISIAREWTPIKDALIDTARILHSYEQVGKAGSCVSFLKNSYELLSLMVGDLIVDTVRTGVKQKWREHYMQAVKELESQGIPLVEDEDREVVANSVEEALVNPPESPKEDTAPAPKIKEENVPKEEAPTEPTPPEDTDDEEPVQNETPDTISQKLSAGLDNLEFGLPPLSDEISRAREKGSSGKAGDIVPFPSSAEEETPYEEAPELDILEEQDLLKLDGVEEKSQKEDLPEQESAEEELFSQKKRRDSVLPEKEETVLEDKKPVEEPPVKEDAVQKEEKPPVEEAPAEETAKEELKPQKAPDEVLPETSEPQKVNDKKEQQPVAEKKVAPPAPKGKTGEKESHAALLERVQAAITSGDTRNTKTMALELAIAMARLEYDQAQQDLAAAEQRLLENERVIAQGGAKVTQMENDLLRAEEMLAARDGEQNANREHISAIDEELSALSAELASIDAEIATLQQKRVEHENRIKNKKAEHEEAISAESRTQTEQEALSQETDSIRENLEKARNNMRASHAESRTIELDIVKIKEEMEARRQSLSIIENTLHPGSATPEKGLENDTLL